MAAMIMMNACIEISEKIKVNADGSGRIDVSVDMGTIVASMNSANTGFDVSLLEKIRSFSSNAPSLLGGIKGISNVTAVSEEKKGYYAVGFDFDHSGNLNKALYLLFGQKKTALSPSLIRITRHKFTRANLSPLVQKALKNSGSGSYNDLLFSYISLNSTYTFPSAVKKSKNIKSKMPDASTVTTSFTLAEIVKGTFDSGNVIYY